MNVNLEYVGAKPVLITDEHAASSYGIPVAVVDGVAYGPMDHLPIWQDDLLPWLKETAKMTVSWMLMEMKKGDNPLSPEDRAFVRRFRDV
jgi:hypothetical protein